LFQKNLAKYTDKPMSFYDDIFSSYKVFNIADKRFLLTHFFMDDNRIYNTISQLTNEKIDPEIEKK
jgi:calcineurin-like phosphoesterase family protein